MRKLKGNTTLIIIIVLSVLLVIAIAIGAYFWGKSKSTTQATKTASPALSSTKSPTAAATPTPTTTLAQTEETPKQTVENFMKYTLGTLPGAQIDYDKARAYLSDTMKAQYSGENWVPSFYGIQDGPTSVKFISENTSDETLTLRYDPSWGETSLGWSFILEKDGNKWYINGFRNDAQ